MGTGEASEKDPADGTFKNLMDLKECIQDSPNFRQQLQSREQEISDLEVKLEKVVTMCDKMVVTGKAYTETCRSFSVSLKELASHFPQGEVVAMTLKKFYEALCELQSFYSVLFDQTQRNVQACLRNYLSSELRKVKETKKSFHRVSDELTNAIHRNGHVPKSKPVEAEDASAHLLTMQNQFSHSAVDYSYQINRITCNKSHEIMQTLLAYMRAQTTFFHEGYDLLRQFDPFMKVVEGKVDILMKSAQAVVQEMELRHTYVSPKHLEDSTQDEPYSPMENPSLPIEMSGYLFKKPQGNNPFKSWSRRWFILKTSKLVYQSESKEEEHVTVAVDLRICTVKLAEDQERRFCFEVVTPTKSCMLQADSDLLRRKWLSYLEAGISRALNISASNKKSEDSDDFRKRSMVVTKGTPIHILSHSPTGGRRNDYMNSYYSLGIDFLDVPGNNACADCGNAKPTWASINLGVMLCIECSGIHRGMGVHISKVRSVTLDDWDPELQKIMCALGNTRVNAIYEFEVPHHIRRPTSESSRSARETFIRLKYVQHAFVHPHPDFQRPEAPVPPISIPELLAPTARGSIGNSPKSPQKRSFSPALKIRPRLLKQISRPSSASSNVTDQSTPTGSDEDLCKSEYAQPCETPTGLHALAENFRKMEEKKKGVSGLARGTAWGASLGDKLKSARRSSKRISNYAMNKLGEGQDSLMKRLKKTGRDRASREFLRETLSDTEEDMTKNDSSLLFSLSASTHNLSSKSGSNHNSDKLGKGVTPPPKPPRTHKLKNLQDLNRDEGNGMDEDDADELPFELDDGKFSSDILSAITNVGSYPNSVDGESGLSNGRIPSTSSSSSLASSVPDGKHMMRSESSPQLSHASILIRSESSNSNINLLSESPRLQTISEDGADNPQLEHERMSLNLSPLPHASPVITPDTRQTNSVPLRRKHKVNGHTPSTNSKDDSAIFLSSAYSGSDGFISSPLDISLPSLTKLESTPEPRSNSSMDNRMSMVSITSAEYFSAESSDGSKPNSVSPSPDLMSGKSTLMSISPILVEEMVSSREESPNQISLSNPGKGRELSRSLSYDTGPGNTDGMREARVNSSLSVDDDSFNTPPSSPCPSATPSPNMSCESASLAVYNALDYHASGMSTLKAGLPLSPRDGAGDDVTTSSSSFTLKGFKVNPVSAISDGSGLEHVESSSTLKGEDSMDGIVKMSEHVCCDSDSTKKKDVTDIAKVNGDASPDDIIEPNGSVLGQKVEQDENIVVISMVERSEQGSRNEDTDSVFSESPVTPTTVTTASPAPVPPKRIKRRRSSTMSSSSADTLPIRGSKGKRKQVDQVDASVSKDDNFETEYRTYSESLVSSFSEKDYEDIFSSRFSLKATIEPVAEEEEIGKGEKKMVVAELEPSPEVEVEIEGEGLVKLGGNMVENGGGEIEEPAQEDRDAQEDGEGVSETVEDWKNLTIIIPDSVHPNSFLYSSVSRAYIPGILCALAHGASPNYANEEEASRTPILNAIQMGNKVIVEYLYQNGCKLVTTDKSGKGCLHYAAVLDNASLVMMLLKRGADPALKDNEGHDPISYALDRDQENGDIITMLRMATLREETKLGDNKQKEQESEFYRDVEVASLVNSGRTSNRMSTPSIEGSSSLDSK